VPTRSISSLLRQAIHFQIRESDRDLSCVCTAMGSRVSDGRCRWGSRKAVLEHLWPRSWPTSPPESGTGRGRSGSPRHHQSHAQSVLSLRPGSGAGGVTPMDGVGVGHPHRPDTLACNASRSSRRSTFRNRWGALIRRSPTIRGFRMNPAIQDHGARALGSRDYRWLILDHLIDSSPWLVPAQSRYFAIAIGWDDERAVRRAFGEPARDDPSSLD